MTDVFIIDSNSNCDTYNKNLSKRTPKLVEGESFDLFMVPWRGIPDMHYSYETNEWTLKKCEKRSKGPDECFNDRFKVAGVNEYEMYNFRGKRICGTYQSKTYSPQN